MFSQTMTNVRYPLKNNNETNESRITYYDANVDRLMSLYESVSFEDVHAPLLPYLNDDIESVLDIGAGSGRDAAALARRGYEVVAIEPSEQMRHQAMSRHPGKNIKWVDDRLPCISQVGNQRHQFDLVIVSAVMMHLGEQEIPPSLERMFMLLKIGGILYLTLRIGEAIPDREIWCVNPENIKEQAKDIGFDLILFHNSSDELGRPEIKWSTLMFRK